MIAEATGLPLGPLVWGPGVIMYLALVGFAVWRTVAGGREGAEERLARRQRLLDHRGDAEELRRSIERLRARVER